MPITNLNNKHLSAEQVIAVQDALTTLENELQEIDFNLTSEDRRKYGSINEQNKLVVNKVYDYLINQPQLASSEVEWEEFKKDFSSRANLEAIIARLDNLTTNLKNAKTLHDYDNYQAALTDYAYTSYKAGTSAPGYETKQKDLKQFFANRGSTTTPPSE
ncbi:hypothetical protein HXZ62_07945 [Empedobacter falsenii]|uniref:hypothetical protein n=1 Tax=Empedobacter falsenii TaxID=343874 RepID=UPI002576D375|nr:hypothetical protein [Empedobacter falsenii]MDM1062492.1 hypothetical protein [Empedobacter falsenii]MDM1547274.1 hypothetical protein [Empedobacter falsenii]